MPACILEIEAVSHTTIHRTTDDLDVVRTMATRDGDDASRRVPHTHVMDRQRTPWHQIAVKMARHDHRSDGCARSVMDVYVLTWQPAARGTKTSETTIKTLVEEGIPLMHQVAPCAHWKFAATSTTSTCAPYVPGSRTLCASDWGIRQTRSPNSSYEITEVIMPGIVGGSSD